MSRYRGSGPVTYNLQWPSCASEIGVGVDETRERMRVLRQHSIEMSLLGLEEIVEVPSDSINGQNAWHVLIGDFASDILVHSNHGNRLAAASGKVERIQQSSLSGAAFSNSQVLTVRWVDLPNKLDLSVDIDRNVFDRGGTDLRHDVDGLGRPHVVRQAQFSHEMLKIGDQKQGVGCSVFDLVLLRVAAYTDSASDMGDGGFDGRTLESSGSFSYGNNGQEASSVDGKGEELRADESELVLTVEIGGGILLHLFVDTHDLGVELVLVTWPLAIGRILDFGTQQEVREDLILDFRRQSLQSQLGTVALSKLVGDGWCVVVHGDDGM
jgi:hypothetical protein